MTDKEVAGFEIGHYYAMIMLVIILIILSGLYMYYHPKDLDDWCARNKPTFNSTLGNPRIEYCFGDGWEKYCEIKFPENCHEDVIQNG